MCCPEIKHKKRHITDMKIDKSSYPDEDSCLKLSQQIINIAFCVQHSADFHGVAYNHINDSLYFFMLIDPAPYFSKDLGSGITDVGFLCGFICFIQFMLDIVCECRILFDIISEFGYGANINHNATSFISLFYHNFIIKNVERFRSKKL